MSKKEAVFKLDCQSEETPMHSRAKLLILLTILAMIILSGCDSDRPTTSGTGSSGDDSGENSEEVTKGSEGDTGTGLISYTHVFNQPPYLVIVIQPDIPLTIRPDTDKPGNYLVQGSARATAFIQIQGQYGENPCFVQCDVPVSYIAEGDLVKDDFNNSCKIPIKFYSMFDFDNVNMYGDCPELLPTKPICEGLVKNIKDENLYTFTKEIRMYPQPADIDVTLKAEIKNVVMPPGMKDTCNW